MNYSKDIEKCIKYIEDHLKKPLSVEEIANVVGYSVYHFSRVFSTIKGISVMEYIRNRKLSVAATELFQGKKIIDIALDYGYETQSGFAKAFKKAFHYSPSQYVARMSGFHEDKTIRNLGGYIMKPTIVKKKAFKVAGYGIKTDVSGSNYTKDIASFWSNYEGENLESKMYEILSPLTHGEVGLCIPSSTNGNVTYLLGVIVDDFSNVQDDMITAIVPEAEYAVFTTPPVDSTKDKEQNEFAQVIRNTWRYIFEEWFKENEYEFDEGKFDFEFYDERCHFRPDTVMEIYVPIKKI